MMLATWIRRFSNDCDVANSIAKQWAEIITIAFENGCYDNEKYTRAFCEILGMKPGTGTNIGLEIFYPISMVCGLLDEKTEQAFVEHLLNTDGGIYYIYDKKLTELPKEFASKEASRYLAAIELLSKYKSARYKLQFIAEWLEEHKNENGKWDMGKQVNDKLYFPISDTWRKAEDRENDCTARISKLLSELRK